MGRYYGKIVRHDRASYRREKDSKGFVFKLKKNNGEKNNRNGFYITKPPENKWYE